MASQVNIKRVKVFGVLYPNIKVRGKAIRVGVGGKLI